MRAKNGLWDKKKEKACKSKGVCKWNKEDIWEGKSSVKDIIGRNEENR